MNGMEIKTEIIKELILKQKRINSSATSSLPDNLDLVPVITLWDRPEATIMNIVQSYFIGKKKGKSVSKIIQEIIEIDEIFPPSDNSYSNFNTDSDIIEYIHYRLAKDYPLLAKFYNNDFIDYCFEFIASQLGYTNYFKLLNEKKSINKEKKSPSIGNNVYSARKEKEAMYFGIIITIIWLIMIFTIGPYRNLRYSFAEHQILSGFALIIRLISVIWIIGISSRLNRSRLGWGIFAFISPNISLIIIGNLTDKKGKK